MTRVPAPKQDNSTSCSCLAWAGLGAPGQVWPQGSSLGKEHTTTWKEGVTAPWQRSMEEDPLPLFSTTLVCFLLLSCWTPWISTVTLGSTMEFLLLFTLGSCWPEMICGGNGGRGQDIIKKGGSLATFPLLLQERRTCCDKLVLVFQSQRCDILQRKLTWAKAPVNTAPAQPGG